MTILAVFDSESTNKPHVYASEVEDTSDVLMDVEEAFEELGIPVEPETVEEIAEYLQNGSSYWFEEQYNFDLIEVLP